MKQAIALIFALLAALQAGDPLACSAARLAVLSLDCLGIPPAACQAAAVLPPRGQDQALVLLINLCSSKLAARITKGR